MTQTLVINAFNIANALFNNTQSIITANKAEELTKALEKLLRSVELTENTTFVIETEHHYAEVSSGTR